MSPISKAFSVAALAAAVTTAAFVETAEAQRYRRGVGIGLGIIGGAIIAGAIADRAYARDRAYSYREPAPVYSAGPSCGHLRHQARWHEENGYPRRASYYWNAYRDCRGY